MLDCIIHTLRALEVPDPAISLVVSIYGEADDGSFPLEEVLWAEEILRDNQNFEEVD